MVELESLKDMAQSVRRRMIGVADHCRGKIHWGSSLSCVEILLSVIGDASNMTDGAVEPEQRDTLIISKGHAALAYYAVLEEVGLLTRPFAESFQKYGTEFTEELEVNKELFIECSTGSLGLGLPFAVGLAIRCRKEGNNKRIFCVVGDGECDEGSNWEAAMLASQLGLDNITLIVDRNGLQADGNTESILSWSHMPERFRAFGWRAIEADGHDFASLREALSAKREEPLAVIANTVKGRGISFMENDFAWHEKVLVGDNLRQAKAEVGICD